MQLSSSYKMVYKTYLIAPATNHWKCIECMSFIRVENVTYENNKKSQEISISTIFNHKNEENEHIYRIHRQNLVQSLDDLMYSIEHCHLVLLQCKNKLEHHTKWTQTKLDMCGTLCVWLCAFTLNIQNDSKNVTVWLWIFNITYFNKILVVIVRICVIAALCDKDWCGNPVPVKSLRVSEKERERQRENAKVQRLTNWLWVIFYVRVRVQ